MDRATKDVYEKEVTFYKLVAIVITILEFSYTFK